ncbi:hypothetical protein BC629DRAFT_142915 [Irpex lacteus]|nr:hypothetical protein BC629DRAFT_142915 [Irpex lacteus]
MIRHSKRLPSKLLEAVIGAIAASPGVELIKRYVYPSGSWKAEDGKVIDGSRAVSEQVHEVLLCWRQTRYLLPRVDSENPLIDTIATFESRTPYGSPSDSHTLLSSLADGSAYDSEYTTSPTRFEFLRKEVAALNELEDDPSSDYASNAGSSDVEDHSAGRGLTTDTFYTSRNIYYSPPSVATHLGPSVKQASPDQESEFRQRPSDRLERESPQSLSTLDESEELIEEDSSLQIRSADGNYNIVHPVGNGNDHERVQNDGNNTTGRPFIHHIYRSPDQGRNEDIRNAHQEIRRLLALLRRSEAERKQLSEQLAQEQIKHEAEMHSARMKAASVEDPLRLVGTSAEVQNHRTSMERHAEKNLPKDSRLADAQVQDHSEEHRSDGAIGVDAGRDMLLESMHTEKDALAARRGDNVDAMPMALQKGLPPMGLATTMRPLRRGRRLRSSTVGRL